jgi:hypothetical protein
MREKLFALKKGTEIADRFDGVTIPYTVPEGLAEVLRVGGASERLVQTVAQAEASADSIDKVAIANAVAVFNQAHSLNVQKHVKEKGLDAESTVDTLRNRAVSFKYGQVRERSGNGTGGATKVKPATVEKVLGADLLASFSPEQRAMYEAQLAALRPKEAAPAATPAPATPPATAKTTAKK